MVRPTSVNTDFIPMATGAKGSNPRSAGNIMPGASAMSSTAGTPPAGGTGGVKGIPSRNGGIAVSSGGYMNQPGSPKQASMPKPGNVPPSSLGGASRTMDVLSHGRTLGAIAHLRKIGGNHAHLDGLHAKATAGLASMKKPGGVGSKGNPGGMSGGFGSLGGSAPIAPRASGPMGNMMGNPQLPDDTAGG